MIDTSGMEPFAVECTGPDGAIMAPFCRRAGRVVKVGPTEGSGRMDGWMVWQRGGAGGVSQWGHGIQRALGRRGVRAHAAVGCSLLAGQVPVSIDECKRLHAHGRCGVHAGVWLCRWRCLPRPRRTCCRTSSCRATRCLSRSPTSTCSSSRRPLSRACACCARWGARWTCGHAPCQGPHPHTACPCPHTCMPTPSLRTAPCRAVQRVGLLLCGCVPASIAWESGPL